MARILSRAFSTSKAAAAGDLTVYGVPMSPPFRSVLLTLDALDLDHKVETVDVLKGQQFKPKFLKLNPQHTVPVLKDGGTVITDSVAEVMYLGQKYDVDGKFLPKDPAGAAMVHQKVIFAEYTLWLRFGTLVVR